MNLFLDFHMSTILFTIETFIKLKILSIAFEIDVKKMKATSECILFLFRNAFHMQDLHVVCFVKLNNKTWRMFKDRPAPKVR